MVEIVEVFVCSTCFLSKGFGEDYLTADIMPCCNPGSGSFIPSGRREPGHLGYFRRTGLSGGMRFWVDCIPIYSNSH